MKFKLRRYVLYYLARCLAILVYIMPFSMALALADIIGLLAFWTVRKYAKITLENLKFVFGSEKTDKEIHRIARQVFRNIARNAVELVRFPKISKVNIDNLIRIEGSQILEAEFSKGKGIVVVTGHIGNWEMMGITLRIKGYPGVAVGKRIYFHKYDEYLNSLRRCHDVNIVYRDDSPRKILKVLKSNGIVGIVADQDVDSVEGVFINFFGKKAYTPAGPAVLAQATGASLVPVVVIREGRRHRLIVDDPIELANTGNKEADTVVNTQRWSDVLESYIRRYPDQWVWMHRRWKTKEA
ncbi:MAG: lysophospholipid acyltransferase family protein [Candidatus Omnitrophica bacterium]|nr:lysophospholipid acyltransferase family protein [Candidatus Omnitrophota bacterium]